MNTHHNEEFENTSLRKSEASIELKVFTGPPQSHSKSNPFADVQTPLIQQENTEETKQNLFSKISSYFKDQQPVSTSTRGITFDGNVSLPCNFDNTMRNQKYSIYSFVFVVLYNQFKSSFNLFCLIIVLSQFIEALKFSSLLAFLIPLVFTIILQMTKEAVADYKIYRQDKQFNSEIYQVLSPTTTEKPSDALKVGDIIQINANQRVPADLLLLYTSNENEKVLLKTDQLDGQTNLTPRKPVRYSKKKGHAKVHIEAPRNDLNNFVGRFETDKETETLSVENTIWANSELASGSASGMVIYIGKEIRISMSSFRNLSKRVERIEKDLDILGKYLLAFMLLLSGFVMIFRGFEGGFVEYLRYVLLFSSPIVISLRATLDLFKAIFCSQINKEEIIVRNQTISEEIEEKLMLIDKTGILTENKMVFKELYFGTKRVEESMKQMKYVLKRQCQKYFRFMKKEVLLKDLMTALCVCHHISTPGKRNYESPSPDEVALIEMAEKVGMKILSTTETSLTIENAAGIKENFKILATFPFTSETKRMGMIVRDEETKRIVFYLKGTYLVLKSKISNAQSGDLSDIFQHLKAMGWRSSVILTKDLTQEEYEAQRNQGIEAFENDMELLGVTGVEEKLQEDVKETVELLIVHKFSVWMLTGDPFESALDVAGNALLTYHAPCGIRWRMENMEDIDKINEMLTRLSERTPSRLELFIDGITLDNILKTYRKLFFEIACRAYVVIFFNVSPAQKVLIIEALKELQQKPVWCIGNGVKDVGMIRSADIGIGLSDGQERNPATLAADYSVPKFKDIKSLLSISRSNLYMRLITRFIIQRGLMISVIQGLLVALHGKVAISGGSLILTEIVTYMFLSGFYLFFSIWKARRRERSEEELERAREQVIGKRAVLTWVWKGLLQGGIFTIFSVIFFKDSPFVPLVMLTFIWLICFSEI